MLETGTQSVMKDVSQTLAPDSMERFVAFDELVRSRRATRHFRSIPIADDVLERIVDTARWAPSGYNLQPTHFVTVTDPAVREDLYTACMNQNPVREAA